MSARPIKRKRSAAAKSRTTQTRRNHISVDGDIVDFDFSTLIDDTTCIDLTVDAEDEIVDLTAVNDSPATVLTATVSGVSSTSGRRRKSSANTQHHHSHCPIHSNFQEIPEITFEPSIPSRKKSKTSRLNKPDENESPVISCPICLDTVPEILKNHHQLMSTTCGHIFCDNCITEIINEANRCPTCRKRITSRQIHPIFL